MGICHGEEVEKLKKEKEDWLKKEKSYKSQIENLEK